MKKPKKIDGFEVMILPSIHSGRISSWTAWLPEQPFARAKAGSYEDALIALAKEWENIKTAFRESGIPAPVAERSRGNKRIHDQIRRLGEKKFNPIF